MATHPLQHGRGVAHTVLAEVHDGVVLVQQAEHAEQLRALGGCAVLRLREGWPQLGGPRAAAPCSSRAPEGRQMYL